MRGLAQELRDDLMDKHFFAPVNTMITRSLTHPIYQQLNQTGTQTMIDIYDSGQANPSGYSWFGRPIRDM
jgi:hypothetical protein